MPELSRALHLFVDRRSGSSGEFSTHTAAGLLGQQSNSNTLLIGSLSKLYEPNLYRLHLRLRLRRVRATLIDHAECKSQ